MGGMGAPGGSPHLISSQNSRLFNFNLVEDGDTPHLPPLTCISQGTRDNDSLGNIVVVVVVVVTVTYAVGVVAATTTIKAVL